MNTIQTVHGESHKAVTLTREPFLTDVQWQIMVDTIKSPEFNHLAGYFQNEVDYVPQTKKGTTFLLWWHKDGNCVGTKITPTGKVKTFKSN